MGNRSLRAHHVLDAGAARRPLHVQAATMRGCGVVVGVHGAAFMNLIFMRPRAAVVELLMPWMRPETHGYYRNVAHLTGLHHFGPPRVRVCDEGRAGGRGCVGVAGTRGVLLQPRATREVMRAAVRAIGTPVYRWTGRRAESRAGSRAGKTEAKGLSSRASDEEYR